MACYTARVFVSRKEFRALLFIFFGTCSVRSDSLKKENAAQWLSEAVFANPTLYNKKLPLSSSLTSPLVSSPSSTSSSSSLSSSRSSSRFPWIMENERLSKRLQDLASMNQSYYRPWPEDTIDMSALSSAQRSIYGLPVPERCAMLTRPAPPPGPLRPVAMILAGQLRTAELAIPFFEELLIKASAPTPVHIFGHVWALQEAPAAERAILRLRQMRELKDLVVEDERRWEEIVKAFYDGIYGEGWIGLQSNNGRQANFWKTSHATFLSQWYKVTSAHARVRRYYLQRRETPSIIVRLRPDHLLHTRWNLTAAAFEFRSRAAARAANGNFIALWGPGNINSFCGPTMCPRGRPRHYPKPDASGPCWSNGRYDDAFALGTPATFDVYAAPYHPYTKNCCENYVTGILPLGNLVGVGAAASSGGLFGSLSMPGSCNHRAGHFPMANLPLVDPHSVPTDGECDAKGKCTSVPEKGREPRGSFLQYLRAHENTSSTPSSPMALPMGDMGLLLEIENVASNSFDQLCAPIFYFNKFGIQILRYQGSIKSAREEQAKLARDGACPPLLKGRGKDARTDHRSSSHSDSPTIRTHCSDIRRPRFEGNPNAAHSLMPRGGFRCDCTPPVTLNIDFEGISKALEAHCEKAGEFEKEAESRRGGCGSKPIS